MVFAEDAPTQLVPTGHVDALGPGRCVKLVRDVFGARRRRSGPDRGTGAR